MYPQLYSNLPIIPQTKNLTNMGINMILISTYT
ncbi:uncharacterized protein METZ01_LOCUS513025 [marine metagenome]|uniref:Uncharacterized protein n=1 Tax=marine metagenome TaxID=408172 RepID=A0A383ETT2_9ZZZZ